MKKTIINSLCVGLLSLISYGQGITSIDVSTEKLYMSSDTSRPIDALGSPYINENFLPLKVKGYDNQIFTGRYNAYNGEMEVNLGTKVIALDKSQPYEVIFTQTNKIYRTYTYSTSSGISKNGFLNVVNSGENFELLKEETIKYYDKVPAATSYQQDKPAKFVEEDPNFYIKKGETVKPLPSRKKDLLRAYSKEAKKIKAYLKSEKISLKDENDLSKLAQFLVTL